MEYSPPPLFKQGASARAKMIVFALIALVLLVVDSRMRSLSIVRQAIGTALYPLEVIAMAPRDGLYHVSDYFTSLSTMKQQNEKLAAQQTLDARALQQGQQLLAENAQLRRLLGTRDAFTRKIVLDRGMKHGVALGQPVIDHAGVVGQVTRVFPFTSEVTLLTDKDQTIPVQVVRSGLRSVTYGRGQSNMLDLRFMPTNADIQKGDVLVTSGIDGIYPPGLAVATVVQVDVKSADAFARILCQPSAGVDRNRQLLILLTDNKIAERPPAEDRDKNTKGGILRHASNRTGGTPTRGQDVQPVPSPDIQPETTQR
jgi:rod shape-determining protein MreC